MYDEKNQEDRQVNTYNPEDLYKKKQTGLSGWAKGLIIFLILALVVVGLGVGCNHLMSKGLNDTFFGETEKDYNYSSAYIGVLSLEGTITDGESSDSSYNQDWLLSRIDAMENDGYNRGIVLRINTPGGSVYATDELYLKLEAYKKKTGRPIYTYMESQAASGGYYISMASDKIYANRNCWTGSIGVTIGTLYDISGFLDRMGVKTVTITSGKNKAMGSTVDPLTKEQQKIFQNLVDEAYDQFVEIVADGRKMKISKVKKLADGRLYTAKQAEDNGLIDQIGTLDEAIAHMIATYDLTDCNIQEMTYTPRTTILSWLNGLSLGKTEDAKGEYDQLMGLIEKNNKFTVTYLSNIKK